MSEETSGDTPGPEETTPKGPRSRSRGGYSALGAIIRQQRELASLPIRQFAAAAGISGPYLSQIERGLRDPSEQVINSIADSLRTTTDSLYERAGVMGEQDEESDDEHTREAIAADPNLTAGQRRALVEIYESFIDVNAVRRRRGKR